MAAALPTFDVKSAARGSSDVTKQFIQTLFEPVTSSLSRAVGAVKSPVQALNAPPIVTQTLDLLQGIGKSFSGAFGFADDQSQLKEIVNPLEDIKEQTGETSELEGEYLPRILDTLANMLNIMTANEKNAFADIENKREAERLFKPRGLKKITKAGSNKPIRNNIFDKLIPTIPIFSLSAILTKIFSFPGLILKGIITLFKALKSVFSLKAIKTLFKGISLRGILGGLFKAATFWVPIAAGIINSIKKGLEYIFGGEEGGEEKSFIGLLREMFSGLLEGLSLGLFSEEFTETITDTLLN